MSRQINIPLGAKPCPFCGTAPESHPAPMYFGLVEIYCPNIDCAPLLSVSAPSEEEALRQWNTRAEPDSLARLVATGTVVEREGGEDRANFASAAGALKALVEACRSDAGARDSKALRHAEALLRRLPEVAS